MAWSASEAESVDAFAELPPADANAGTGADVWAEADEIVPAAKIANEKYRITTSSINHAWQFNTEASANQIKMKDVKRQRVRLKPVASAAV